jgi:hypothetical protein
MLKERSVEQLTKLRDKVEEKLGTIPRPTKKMVLEVLSGEGHCSPKSAGIEKTFLKVLKTKLVPLGPRFAALMGETTTSSQSASSQSASSRPTPPSAPTGENQAPPPPVVRQLLNFKSVSEIKFKDGRAEVTGLDGTVAEITGLDEAKLRSGCNLIEFNA